MKLTTLEIIRAWKDPEYRASLDASTQAELPAHPAGPLTLSDEELGYVIGGGRTVCGSHHDCPPPPPPTFDCDYVPTTAFCK